MYPPGGVLKNGLLHGESVRVKNVVYNIEGISRLFISIDHPKYRNSSYRFTCTVGKL